MTRSLACMVAVAAALAPVAAGAAPQTVTETAKYLLSDSDSRNDARQICAANAKRAALEKAGSVFESDLTTQKAEAGGKLTDDTRLQMRSYAAAVVSSEVTAEQFIVSNDRLLITCSVRVTFDADETRRKLNDIAGSSELHRKLAAQQAQMDKLQEEMRQLSDSVKAPPPASPRTQQAEAPAAQAERPAATRPPPRAWTPPPSTQPTYPTTRPAATYYYYYPTPTYRMAYGYYAPRWPW